jgi:hypothetical protein
MAPLLREHQAAVNKQVGATAQGAVLDTQFKADSMEGLNQLTQIQLDSLKAEGGPLNPDIIQRSNDVITKYGLMRTQQGAAWMRETLDAKKVQDFYSIFGHPTSASVVDKESGATVNFGSKREPLAATQEIESLMNAAAANDKAQGITRTPAELAQRRLDFTQDKVLPMGSTETIKTPDGTEVTRVIGRQPAGGAKSGVPAAVTTDATKKITAIQDTISQISSIKQSLRPEDVGVKGFVADKIFDTLAPAFGVNTGDATRMDNREKINALFEGAKTIVSADKRFSNADHEDTKKIFPGTGPLDNYQKNIIMMSALERIQGKRALIEAANAKMPPPDFAVKLLNQQGIKDAFDSGLLTAPEVMSELKRRKAIEDANQ